MGYFDLTVSVRADDWADEEQAAEALQGLLDQHMRYCAPRVYTGEL